MSLRVALIIIAIVDIVMGGSAIGIAGIALSKNKLELSLAAYCIVNIICLVLAIISLYAIAKKKIKIKNRVLFGGLWGFLSLKYFFRFFFQPHRR